MYSNRVHRLVEEYTKRHSRKGKPYGATGHNSLPCILPHVLALKPSSIIDYGCGRSDLSVRIARRAGITRIARYDPAIPEISSRPENGFDLLTSVDMFEHIPDDEIDEVARDMAALAENAILMIDTAPAGAKLSDGRNAHVSLHDESWWLQRLSKAWPTLQPIRPFRKHRVAFKTWDADLPSYQYWIVSRSELWKRRFRRWTKQNRKSLLTPVQ